VSLQVEFSNFLNELWVDVAEPSVSRVESLDYAYSIMAEVEGKPFLSHIASMYDNITGDEVSAVFSHRNHMMWPRIVNSGAWICHNMEDGERVLDLGSNTGHQLLWWATKFPNSKFTGLEISERSVEVAERWLKKKPVDNVKFLTGNLVNHQPEIKNEMFDVITTCFTLETIPDLYQLNHCAMPDWVVNSLAPNGKIIACLTVPNWHILTDIINAWREQGFNLISLNLYPVEYAAYPYLIMDKKGEDMDIDIVDFMVEKMSILYD
jgi:SAM-dependent methyltransferase